MGSRGPRPAPTAIKRAKGVRSDRINNSSEPVPTEGRLPPCPRHLSPGAKRVWRLRAPDLHRRGVLTSWDVEMFAFYCDLADQAERARELLGPGLLLNRGDSYVTNPAWRIYRDIISELRLLAREFGLTPSARSLMRLPERQTGDTDGQPREVAEG